MQYPVHIVRRTLFPYFFIQCLLYFRYRQRFSCPGFLLQPRQNLCFSLFAQVPSVARLLDSDILFDTLILVLHEYAMKLVREEVERYKNSLERSRIKYKIVSEETQPDGSVLIKIIKQYVSHPVGEYLD